MEKQKKKVGRQPVADDDRKRNRGISLTDSEYAKLVNLAKQQGFRGPSAFLVHHHQLNVEP